MKRKFTSLGTSIAYVLFAMVISIYLKLPIWGVFLMGLGLIHNDYKVVLNKNGVEFYSFFRKNRFFKWNEIEKIEYKKTGLFQQFREIIIVHYCSNLRYKFNLYFINGSYDCVTLINRYARRRKIPFVDLRKRNKFS